MMTAAQIRKAPAVATVMTTWRSPAASDKDTRTNRSKPFSTTAATGNTALSAQLICRLRAAFRSTVGEAVSSRTSPAGMVAEAFICLVSLANLAPGFSTFQSRAGETELILWGLLSSDPCPPALIPHAYACKPGSKYVTPRKVKITTPNPRMAKYAALRPRHPRVIRICK